MASIKVEVTRTVKARWALGGNNPTAGELRQIVKDLDVAQIDNDQVLEYERAYADITEYPASFSFEAELKQKPKPKVYRGVESRQDD